MKDVLLNPHRSGFVMALQRMGADLAMDNIRGRGGETIGDVRVRFGPLFGAEFTAEEIPSMVDEIPMLAVVAAGARGETRIEGLDELRHKESDRLALMAEGLSACGVEARAEGDALVVQGGPIRGGGDRADRRRSPDRDEPSGAGPRRRAAGDGRRGRDDRHQLPHLPRRDAGAGREDRGGGGMSWNSFGRLFRFTTWGESHGPAIGVVVDGCPPGLALDEEHVQGFLDQRRPGTGKNVSPRQEPDRVRILSGLYEGRTTGTPIAMLIENVDQRSKDYAGLPPRPGHADAAYDAKYGFRDPRGGGRASARETAMRVAAGAIARLVIPEVTVTARVAEIGGEADPERWESLLDEARGNQDSLGAVIECVAEGAASGWGAPIYAKLDADLAAAVMGINAVKGVEIGEGFAAGRASGRASLPLDAGERDRRRNRDRPSDPPARGVQADQQHRDRRTARPLRRDPRRAGGRGDGGARAGRP